MHTFQWYQKWSWGPHNLRKLQSDMITNKQNKQTPIFKYISWLIETEFINIIINL
jgi:hypothetical protein